MTDENLEKTTTLIRWRGDIGPAFLVGVGQLLFFVITGTMVYASLSNTVANTKESAEKLTLIVKQVQEKNNDQNNRIVRVETILDDVKVGVSKLADKMDNLIARPSLGPSNPAK